MAHHLVFAATGWLRLYSRLSHRWTAVSMPEEFLRSTKEREALVKQIIETTPPAPLPLRSALRSTASKYRAM